MTYTITIEQDKCIGCGACTSIAPENFEMTNEGKAIPKKKQVENLDNINTAIDSCPVQCIIAKEQ